MKRLDNKAQANIQGFVMSIVGVAVVLAIGLIVLGELKTSQIDGSTNCTSAADSAGCGAAYNATGTIVTKLATIPTWIGILITVALAFIVLSYFYGKAR